MRWRGNPILSGTPARDPRASRFPAGGLILVIAAIYFSVFRFFVPLTFSTNDDSAMMMLASGTYDGTASSYLVYINHYLGLVFSGLYRLTSAINWYPTLFLAALSLCAALLCLHLWEQRRAPSLVAPALFIALLGLLTVFTAQMQFTTLAATSLVIGIWVILTAPARTAVLAGAVLVMFGALLRFEAGLLALAVSAPFGLAELLERRRSLWRYGLVLALLATEAGLFVSSTHIYRTTAPDYFETISLRASLNDNPNAYLAAEDLPEGVSEAEFDLLLKFFVDTNVQGPEEHRALHAAVQAREAALTPMDFVSNAKLLANKRWFLVVVALGLVMALFSPTRTVLLARISALLILILALSYFATTAILKERVFQAGAIAYLAGLFFQNQTWKTWLSALPVLALAALLALYWGKQAVTLTHNTGLRAADFLTKRALIETWPGDVVVFSGLGPNHARLFTTDYAPLEGRVFFKGWLAGHPDNLRYNRYADLLGENVALFMSEQDIEPATRMLGAAISENYAITTRSEVIGRQNDKVLLILRAADN